MAQGEATFELALLQAANKTSLEKDIAGFNTRTGELTDALTKAFLLRALPPPPMVENTKN